MTAAPTVHRPVTATAPVTPATIQPTLNAPAHRPGGEAARQPGAQVQHIETPLPDRRDDSTQRIDRTRELLEHADRPVDRVTELSSPGSAANLRRHFTRTVGVPPNDYRRSYRTTSATRTI